LHRTPSNPQRLVGSPANPGRPVSADSGEVTHARCPKPGSAMHRLWFSHEAGRDRAEHAGPGLANVFLPTMQASPAPRHRQRRDRSLGSAKTVKAVIFEPRTRGSPGRVTERAGQGNSHRWRFFLENASNCTVANRFFCHSSAWFFSAVDPRCSNAHPIHRKCPHASAMAAARR